MMPTYKVFDNRGHYQEFQNRIEAHGYATSLMYLDKHQSSEIWNSLMLDQDCRVHCGCDSTTIEVKVQGD